MDLVLAALRQHGVSIQFVSPEEQQLNGADAKFIPDFDCILVRNDVNAGRQAELLAHELGHIVMHQAAAICDVAHIDITTQESGAIARANAYGPRERRELQANVFGREFLLPQNVARKFFLADRLTALEISERLKLELGLVRLQLVDALLVGDDQAGMGEDTHEEQSPSDIKKDDSQTAAAEYPGQAYLLEAGPGSGKTRTLAKRVDWLLAQKVSADRILALTFSNKAAAELSHRIGRANPQAALKIWSGTFHAFGLELLRRHYDKLGLPANPRLIGKTEAVEMLEERLPVMDLRHFHNLRSPGSQLDVILDAISRAKDELIESSQFGELATSSLAAASDEAAQAEAERAVEAGIVYAEYERAKRELGLLDFGDLVMLPTLLLETNDEVCKQEASRYREILVDEYQDVNRASARMLKAFFREGARLWVVGDARQSIYRFRGASPQNMGLFESDFPGGNRGALAFNYRSSELVVAGSRSFATGMLATHDKSLPYDAESRGPQSTDVPLVIVTDTTAAVSAAVASQISSLVDEGVALSEQVVLSPTNNRLDAIAAHLAEVGIPTVHLGSLFERDEVRDVLSILSLISEPGGGALSRVGTFSGAKLGSAEIGACTRAVQEGKTTILELLRDVPNITGVSETGLKSLEQIAVYTAGFTKNSSASEIVLTWLLDRSDYLRDLSGQTGIDASLSRAALLRLLEIIRDRDLAGRPLTAASALQRIRSILILGEDRSLREAPIGSDVDAVRLMTIHGAKGLEFSACHIIDMNEETFPGKPRKDSRPLPAGVVNDHNLETAHIEERECEFFVAISRAEKYLRLYRSDRVVSKPCTRSLFLDRISAKEIRFSEPGISDKEIKLQRTSSVDEGIFLRDLREYERCPLKIAYRRNLNFRARQHESAFLKTTAVTYGVVDKLPAILANGINNEISDEIFDDLWNQRGPVGHSLEPEYRVLAERNLASLRELVTGFHFQQEADIVIEIEGGQLKVPVPLIGPNGNGEVVARFVEAGSASSNTGAYLADRMRKFAALQAFGKTISVEIAHISCGKIVPLKARASTLEKAHKRTSEVLSDIRHGRLHPKPDRRVCVRCPYFFSCPSTGADI